MWTNQAACVFVLLLFLRMTCGQRLKMPADAPTVAIEIGLDVRRTGQWQEVDPRTVFHTNDEIRFRFRTSAGGYLYVLNRSSDGENTWLFPRIKDGQKSRVEPGPTYLVPGTNGSFAIAGRPGFDVTYWILSPTPIEMRGATSSAGPSQPSTIEPRCRTEVLKVPGLCVDDRAGAQPIERPEQAPVDVPRDAPLVSRELKFQTQQGSTRISGADSQSSTIIYEFRIAHN